MFGSAKLIGFGVAVIVFLAIVSGAYLQGRSDGSAKCEARWLKLEKTRIEETLRQQAERDARVAEEMAEIARRARERLETIKELQDKVHAYELEQANRDDCDITDNDARSLSNIR